MSAKTSHEIRVRTVKQKRKNGDICIIERRTQYDPIKKYNVVLSSRVVEIEKHKDDAEGPTNKRLRKRTDINLSEFAKRLKAAREKAGYSQDRLAEKVGMGYSTLCRYEQESRDHVYPSLINLLRLAQVLDVTPEYLLEGKDDKNLYMDDLAVELKALGENEIAKYHEMDMSDKVLAHLKLSDQFVREIQNSWGTKETWNGKRAIYNRPYVLEVILKYASNRPSGNNIKNGKAEGE